MSETCRYCSAENGVCGRYSCGTAVDCSGRSGRGEECFVREISTLKQKLAAYRNLLPLPPSEWGGEITAEVCARLGMERTLVKQQAGMVDLEWWEWRYKGIRWDEDDEIVYVDQNEEHEQTAGQLMFLVAARRMGKQECPQPHVAAR